MKLSNKIRRLLVAYVSFLIIFAAIGYMLITPRPTERFFQLYLLGEAGTAAKYYPNENSSIPLNTPVKWHIMVINYAGSTQLVTIKVKLGNSTIPAPDEREATPSPAPTLFEGRMILAGNETGELPFSWTIKDLSVENGMIYQTLEVNNITIGPLRQVGVPDGKNFRMIVELWTWDEETGEAVFGWTSLGERRAAWLQLWFNATRPS